jgi:RNA polymerase sigma factor for flagellar operon FliA
MESPMADPQEIELERYQDYARSLAGQIARRLPSHVERDDIDAAAMLGLVEARERFDATRGASFKTFAYHRIRGAIFDHLRDSTYLRPEDWKTLNQLEAIDEIAAGQAGNLSSTGFAELVSRAREAARQIAVTVVVSDLGPDEEESEGCDGVEERGPADIAAESEIHARLHAAIGDLPERERQVIRMRFFEHKSVTAIAKHLGIHKSNVTRCCQNAYAMLQQHMGPMQKAG